MSATTTTRRRVRPTATTTIIWSFTVVGLLLRLERFLSAGPRNGIVGYDDGVYFGASVRLVHGSLPYRDFVFVHPPVITELLAPLAALSPHVSTVHLVAVARILTALVGTATIPLLGRLLRHRGPLAVAVGCGVLALHEGSIATTRAVLIEPYLAFFVVLALVILFDGDEPAGPKRTFWAGVVLGVAAATKIWALGPIVVVLALFARDRSRLRRLAAGVVLGGAVPCLPLFIAAPHDFVRDVVVAQLTRHTQRSGEFDRMDEMLGLAGFDPMPHAVTFAVVVVLVVLLVLGYRRLWRTQQRRPNRLEVLAIAATLVTLAMFYAADIFFWHYAGFFAVFLSLLLALPLTGMAVSRPHARPVLAGLLVAALAAGAYAYSSIAYNHKHYWTNVAVARIDAVLPAGGCIINDNPAFALAVDRLATLATCPVIVDPFGTGLVFGNGKVGPAARRAAHVRKVWTAAFEHADALLLRRASLRFLPWKELRPYVLRHFRIARFGHGSYLVFTRRGS